MADEFKNIVTVEYETSGIESVEAANQKVQDGVSALGQSYDELRQKVEEARNEQKEALEGFGAQSEQFQAATKKVAEMEGAIAQAAQKASEQQEKLNTNTETLNKKLSDTKKQTTASTEGMNEFTNKGATGVYYLGNALTGLGGDLAENTTLAKVLQAAMVFQDATDGIENVGKALGIIKDRQKEATAATEAQTAATEGQAAATEGATVATSGLGTALKALGIGLIISLIAYLIANFDKVKAKIQEVLPFTKDLGKTWDVVSASLKGFGSALLTFVATPIKIIIDLFKGDFKGAINDAKSGFNLLQNTANAFSLERARQELEKFKASQKIWADAYSDIIKIQEAGGLNASATYEKMYNARLNSVKGNAEEERKIEVERDVWRVQQLKKEKDQRDQAAKEAAQKAKQERDKYLSDLKAYNEQIQQLNESAAKVIRQKNLNDRQKELDDLASEHAKQLELFKKRNRDTSKLNDAYQIQQNAINKKYNDETTQGIKALNDEFFSSANEWDSKKQEVDKTIKDLLKNATASDKAQLIDIQARINKTIDGLKSVSDAANKAQANLNNVQANNIADDNDSPEVAYKKKKAIFDAQIIAENENYTLQIANAQGNASQIELIQSQHNLAMAQLYKQDKDNVAAAEKQKYDQRTEFYTLTGQASGALANLFAQHTVAYKALAIAEATMNTFTGISGIWKNTDAYIKAYGPYLAVPAQIVSTGIVAAQGIAAVKQIMSVDVAGASGSASSVQSASISGAATQTVNTSASSVQDVRVTNSQDAVIKAYITQGDLDTANKKQAFKDKVSTF